MKFKSAVVTEGSGKLGGPYSAGISSASTSARSVCPSIPVPMPSRMPGGPVERFQVVVRIGTSGSATTGTITPRR